MDPYLGELRFFGFNFAPRGWAQCSGQLLAINQNAALFSLLGTAYGGDGTQTFGLPDLRGRAPVGQGQSALPSGSSYAMGQSGGSETATLATANLPPHTHAVPVTTEPATTTRPGVPARGGAYAPSSSAGGATTGDGPGRSVPFAVQSPYQVGNWCIALTGIYPTRS